MSSASVAARRTRTPATSAAPAASSPSGTRRANSGAAGIATVSRYHRLAAGAAASHSCSRPVRNASSISQPTLSIPIKMRNVPMISDNARSPPVLEPACAKMDIVTPPAPTGRRRLRTTARALSAPRPVHSPFLGTVRSIAVPVRLGAPVCLGWATCQNGRHTVVALVAGIFVQGAIMSGQ